MIVACRLVVMVLLCVGLVFVGQLLFVGCELVGVCGELLFGVFDCWCLLARWLIVLYLFSFMFFSFAVLFVTCCAILIYLCALFWCCFCLYG